MKSTMPKLVYARLVLCGAIVGAALFGLLGPVVGLDSSAINELASAAAGAMAVVAARSARLI